jgi:hypothetical protein
MKWVVLALAMLMIAGCGAQSSNAPEKPQEEEAPKKAEEEAKPEPTSTQDPGSNNQGSVPDYKLDRIEPDEEVDGYVKGNAVAYTVTSPDYLQAITEEIRADNPEYDILIVQFFTDIDERTDQLTGVRYAYTSEEAAQAHMRDIEKEIEESVPTMEEFYDEDFCKLYVDDPSIAPEPCKKFLE